MLDATSKAKLPAARQWKLARRNLPVGERTLVMGILNVTPDSFSDGGRFSDVQGAVAHAERMIAEGADLLDIGGESTRPGGFAVSLDEELRRVIPVVEAIVKKTTVPVSIDTTKARVARAALDAGAEIVNDISALRFEPELADEAARDRAGLVLMHSRGTLETMHRLPSVENIWSELAASLRASVDEAVRRGVQRESIALDPGIGFSKTQAQNLELVARLNLFGERFPEFPILVGTSRKSFIGRLLDGAPVEERVFGTMATVTTAILRGAHIVRVHDVRAAVETARIADALKAVHVE